MEALANIIDLVVSVLFLILTAYALVCVIAIRAQIEIVLAELRNIRAAAVNTQAALRGLSE